MEYATTTGCRIEHRQAPLGHRILSVQAKLYLQVRSEYDVNAREYP